MKKFELWQGDCLELMKNIPDGSVDLVLTDPPYGTMKGIDDKHDWDTIICTEKLFAEISRVLRRNGKAVLFCQEPYTSHLITNVPPSMIFCYRGIWLKNCSGNSMMSKNAMTSRFEDFCVFICKNNAGKIKNIQKEITELVYKIGFMNFAKIMYGEGRYKDVSSACKNLNKKINKPNYKIQYDSNFFDEQMYRYLETQIKMPYTFDEYFTIVAEYKEKTKSVFNLWQGGKSKSNVLEYKKDNDGYHPTQKPVALLEDLIQTYSNDGETVLDFTAGSGSTGVACVNTNRRFIGIELDEGYFNIAKKRIEEAVNDLP